MLIQDARLHSRVRRRDPKDISFFLGRKSMGTNLVDLQK